MLGRDLAEHGVCVVSGFARGIDSQAHKGAIEGKGKTIAVFGTGIDGVYPKENAKLVDEILDSGGAIVSQFPLGTPPLRENFPYRNRIISGLSYGILIIEASERSGSLITARLAMEQDREVLAIPGNITSKTSFGTNYLIKSGAKLVQQWQDVVSEFPAEIAAEILPPKVDEEDKKDEKPKSDFPKGLSINEKKIYENLKADVHKHIDLLLGESDLSFGELNSAIVSLDLKDLILVLPGNNYARKI
jgi:DNA processing protein